ncbi:MAG: DNRLRE domain-containing protein [Clostridiaceae bacterium]|nr:DNRLRE domain-containing protein [Clostridiaceae bacterium]
MSSCNTGTNVTVEFDVTPLYSNTSGIIGYADSSTTINSFSSMPIIVSMDADKYFYARNGGSYAKDANVSFSANNTYHVKIVANMQAKTYDVFVTPNGGSTVQIANDYAFRTGAPKTDDIGKVCLNSATTNNNDFKVTNHKVTTGASMPVTFNPVADAFVRGGSYANSNYGTSTTLEVKVDNNNSYVRKSYLKFNYGSISGSSVQSAKLRVYVSSFEGDASTIKLYGNSVENWSESSITWNNAPAASTYIESIYVSAAGQWYEIDVTNYVNSNMSDKTVSFVLLNDGTYTAGNRTFFSSREASDNKPKLVIIP